jgi:hypothetical protein
MSAAHTSVQVGRILDAYATLCEPVLEQAMS